MLHFLQYRAWIGAIHLAQTGDGLLLWFTLLAQDPHRLHLGCSHHFLSFLSLLASLKQLPLPSGLHISVKSDS